MNMKKCKKCKIVDNIYAGAYGITLGLPLGDQLYLVEYCPVHSLAYTMLDVCKVLVYEDAEEARSMAMNILKELEE